MILIFIFNEIKNFFKKYEKKKIKIENFIQKCYVFRIKAIDEKKNINPESSTNRKFKCGIIKPPWIK